MSRNHIAMHPVLWARARKAALARAGYRSEVSGLCGRLEVHHRVRLEDGGAPYALDNLMVLTRAEHIGLHRVAGRSPQQLAWDAMVAEIMSERPLT